MRDIYRRMVEGSCKYQQDCIKRATCVYVGHEEFEELCAFMSSSMTFIGLNIRHLGERPQIMGMDVYHVDEKNHLSFGRTVQTDKNQSPAGETTTTPK